MLFRSLKKPQRLLIREQIKRKRTLSLKMARWKNYIMKSIACRRLLLRWRRSEMNNRNLSTFSKLVRLIRSVLRLILNYRCKKLKVISPKRTRKMPN